ncbi:hypothetical protein CLU79DRAFT_688193, partial [Phycomyces nitens]
DYVILKRICTTYYLWNLELFNTVVYKAFEVKLLEYLEEDATFISNYRAQMAILDLVATLQAKF